MGNLPTYPGHKWVLGIESRIEWEFVRVTPDNQSTLLANGNQISKFEQFQFESFTDGLFALKVGKFIIFYFLKIIW